MVEFTYIDLVLLIWAMCGTASAFHFKEQASVAKRILVELLNNPLAYHKMSSKLQEFRKKVMGERDAGSTN